MPHGQAPVAVIGFGKTIPTPEEAVERGDRANTRRHGSAILNKMNRGNEEIREAQRKATDDAAEIAAEILEYGYRKMGAHPSPRIFVPGKKD